MYGRVATGAVGGIAAPMIAGARCGFGRTRNFCAFALTAETINGRVATGATGAASVCSFGRCGAVLLNHIGTTVLEETIFGLGAMNVDTTGAL
jgi:hypothetical protein